MEEYIVKKHYTHSGIVGDSKVLVPSLEYLLEHEKARREAANKGTTIGFWISEIKDAKGTVLKTEKQLDAECKPSEGFF